MVDNKVTAGQSGKHAFIKGTLGDKIAVLACTLIVMLVVVSFLAGLIHLQDDRSGIISMSVFQNLLCFIFPAWLCAYLCSPRSMDYLGADKMFDARQAAVLIAIMLVAMPCMNAIVDWNEHLSLPQSLSGLETMMRDMEDRAGAATDVLLGDNSVWGLISGILFIGVLTGIGEEAFFRGGIQKALTSSRINPHVAVWTAAFVFSAIHFQFFGFVPRLLLGAFLGYVYLFSGSLWLPALGHALNNSLVVVMAWLVANGMVEEGFGDIGTLSNGGLIWAAISAVATLAFILFLKPQLKNRKQ